MLFQRSFIFVASALFSISASAAPVVASIKPISLIATELLDGVAEVQTLLPEGASPHDYALKPSDRRMIDETELMIWIGPDVEPYLTKVIAASRVADMRWLETAEEHAEHVGEEHAHEEHEHDEHDHQDSLHSHDADHADHADHAEHDAHEGHDHDDLHPWLSPESAKHFAERLSVELQQRFPASAERIAANTDAFLSSLVAFDSEALALLEPLKETGFLVFHDAYQGLVEHYSLNQVGFFTLDPSRKPGAKHLGQLREQLEQAEVNCVFVEPQYSAALIESVTRGLNVRQGELDPLAGAIEPAVGSYQRFMSGLVKELERCLAPL